MQNTNRICEPAAFGAFWMHNTNRICDLAVSLWVAPFPLRNAFWMQNTNRICDPAASLWCLLDAEHEYNLRSGGIPLDAFWMHNTNRIRASAAPAWCGRPTTGAARFLQFLKLSQSRASRDPPPLCTNGGKSAQEGLLESFSTVFLTGVGHPIFSSVGRAAGRPPAWPLPGSSECRTVVNFCFLVLQNVELSSTFASWFSRM